MSQLDYSSITPDQLDLVREPRRSRFAVVHKPTETRGETPVIPGSHEPARFRRPTTVPKENRTEDMIGFIEGRGDDSGMWPLIGGESPRNEYLDALCQDPEALRKTFEGGAEETSAGGETARQPVPGDQPEGQEPEPQTPEPPAVEAQPTPESEAAAEPSKSDGGTVDPEEMGEIDDLLAGLDT